MGVLGSRLKDLRKAQGLTIELLARDLGVTKGYISEIENSKKEPSLQLLKAIAARFATSEHWLLTGEGPRELDDQVIGPDKRNMVAPNDPALAELVWDIAEWWAVAREDERTWLKVHLRQTVPGLKKAGK